MATFKGIKLVFLLMFAIMLTTKCFSAVEPPKREDPVTFVRNFYKWYKTKFDYLDHHLYLVDMDFKKNTPYRINFTKTEEYLSILKSSGFFSDSYISYYRTYFKKIDLTLQKTKQNDGPVDGLDFDSIMHTQEPESYLANLNVIRLKLIYSTDKNAIVKMKTTLDPVESFQLLHLVKVNGKYLIDKITTSWYLGEASLTR
jgi:hypothetical protein